jgi:hypothetical protein
VLDRFQSHVVVGLEDGGLVVGVQHSGGISVSGCRHPTPAESFGELCAMTASLMPMQVALISASHKIREIFYWLSVFQE